MIIEYLPGILNFNPISVDKYDNCKTREQAVKERAESNWNNAGDGSIAFNVGYLYDLDNELFAGDEIIGIYSKDGQVNCCLYRWKENNPKEITAFVMLNKFTVAETIDDIQIIQPAKEMGRKKLLLSLR